MVQDRKVISHYLTLFIVAIIELIEIISTALIT